MWTEVVKVWTEVVKVRKQEPSWIQGVRKDRRRWPGAALPAALRYCWRDWVCWNGCRVVVGFYSTRVHPGVI